MRRPTFRLSIGWVLGGACAACVATAAAQQQQQQPRSSSPPRPAPAASTPAVKPAAASPAPADGSVAGRVVVPEGQRLPETVVYLEAADPKLASAPPPPAAEPVVVSQREAKFMPGLLVVPVGTSVDFRNDEGRPVQHNVFSTSEARRFDLGLYGPGEPIEAVRFDKPGPVRLRCSIHRYMDGVVFVAPTPHFAVVGPDGRFAIAGVRPGAYRLKTWQRSQRYREQELPVTVAGGEAGEVTVEMKR